MGKKELVKALGASVVFSLLLTQYGVAAPLQPLAYDLTTAGTETNAGNPGNSFNYSTDGYQLGMSAWSVSSSGQLSAATLVFAPSGGFGVCNASELPLNDCLTKGGGKDALLDNKSGTDWILILLPEYMTINSFSVSTDSNDLRSVTYLTGRVAASSDIAGRTYASLEGFTFGEGFDSRVSTSQGKAAGAATFTVTHGGYRNALLIGASLQDANAEFRLTGLDVTTVPLPAGVWLFASALAGLAARRKLQRAM